MLVTGDAPYPTHHEPNSSTVQNRGYGARALWVDGANLRRGLSRDLQKGAGDDQEAVRRVGEVALTVSMSGLLVIVTTPAPYREDREMAQEMHRTHSPPLLFSEVFIDDRGDSADNISPAPDTSPRGVTGSLELEELRENGSPGVWPPAGEHTWAEDRCDATLHYKRFRCSRTAFSSRTHRSHAHRYTTATAKCVKSLVFRNRHGLRGPRAACSRAASAWNDDESVHRDDLESRDRDRDARTEGAGLPHTTESTARALPCASLRGTSRPIDVFYK